MIQPSEMNKQEKCCHQHVARISFDDLAMVSVVNSSKLWSVPPRKVFFGIGKLLPKMTLTCMLTTIFTYVGKYGSNAFGNTNSLSMAINVQKETPTFRASGQAKAPNT